MPHAHLATPGGLTRARGLGIPFAGEPGPANAITDVAGVAVGYATIIQGEGPLVVGQGPVRTGVTAILPRPRDRLLVPVHAGAFSFNGNGEMTGLAWIAEAGQFQWPVVITNTHSCGIARDAVIRWARRHFPAAVDDAFGLPVAAETYDGWLSDINGFHVTEAHVFDAIDAAREGPVEEGSVGGGTGMICYGFKGGSGTASRRLPIGSRRFTLGAFVQANFGDTRELTIAGRRIGPALLGASARRPRGGSSIIAVLATDAPLAAHQLGRLARRASIGIARSGTFGHHGSGDIFLAFSTANEAAFDGDAGVAAIEAVPDSRLDGLLEAAVEAVDEAVIDALVANRDMTGRDGHHVPRLPHDEVRRLLDLR